MDYIKHTYPCLNCPTAVINVLPLGICADVAASKYEHWSSLAPLPFEVVISAGQKAKEEESWSRGYFLVCLFHFLFQSVCIFLQL